MVLRTHFAANIYTIFHNIKKLSLYHMGLTNSQLDGRFGQTKDCYDPKV